jgi:hypothetical protein
VLASLSLGSLPHDQPAQGLCVSRGVRCAHEPFPQQVRALFLQHRNLIIEQRYSNLLQRAFATQFRNMSRRYGGVFHITISASTGSNPT